MPEPSTPETPAQASAAPTGRVGYAGFLLLLLLLLCAVLSIRPLWNFSDAWSHAAIGRWIWTHHEVPRHTLFLWSADQTYLCHSWLAELGFYGLMTAGGEYYGPALLLGVLALLVCLTFGLVWWFWGTRGPLTSLAGFLFMLGVQTANSRFTARPDAITALFFVVLLLFLIKWHELPRSFDLRSAWRNKSVWGLCALFLLWANVHGAFAFGIVILTLTGLADAVQDQFSPRSRALLSIALACALVANVNPNGPRIWLVLAPIHSLTFQHINEWKPIWVPTVEEPQVLTGQVVLLMLALVAWWRSGRRLAPLVWLVVTAASYWQARRQVEFSVLTSLMVLASAAGELDTGVLWREWLQGRGEASSPSDVAAGERWLTRLRWPVRAVTVGCFALLLLQLAPRRGYSPAFVSGNLAEFLGTVPPGHRIFNDYDTASYLEWRLGGRPPLFIDGVNAYPDAVQQDYLDVMDANARGQAILKSGRFDLMVFGRFAPGQDQPGVLQYLALDSHWKLIYEHPDGIVFVRQS